MIDHVSHAATLETPGALTPGLTAVVKRATDVLLEQFPRVCLVLKAGIRPGHFPRLRTKVELVDRFLTE